MDADDEIVAELAGLAQRVGVAKVHHVEASVHPRTHLSLLLLLARHFSLCVKQKTNQPINHKQSQTQTNKQQQSPDISLDLCETKTNQPINHKQSQTQTNKQQHASNSALHAFISHTAISLWSTTKIKRTWTQKVTNIKVKTSKILKWANGIFMSSQFSHICCC